MQLQVLDVMKDVLAPVQLSDLLWKKKLVALTNAYALLTQLRDLQPRLKKTN